MICATFSTKSDCFEHWSSTPILAGGYLSSPNHPYFALQFFVDTGAIGYLFINEKIVPTICEYLQIEPYALPRPRRLRSHDGKLTPPVTHALITTLTVSGHTEYLAQMMITKLGEHAAILGLGFMEKHGILANAMDRNILFLPNHCDHPGAHYDQVSLADESLQRLVVNKRKLSDEDLGPSISPPPCPPRKATYYPSPPTVEEDDTLSIRLIGAAPFLSLAKKRSNRTFALSLFEIDELISQEEDSENDIYMGNMEVYEANEEDPVTAELLDSKLPEEYRHYHDVFDKRQAEKLPPHREYDHKIELTEAGVPPRTKIRPQSSFKLNKIREYLEENLNKGFIEASRAPYGSQVLFAQKANGDLRFCVDYRQLNNITRKNRYPLPLIDEVLARIYGCKYITRLDIIAAFNKLRMHPDSEELTTFVTSLGAYKYKVLPFGLCNGPSSFQHYMNDTLWEYLNKFVQCYLDDILIYSRSLQEHKIHVAQVLDKLREFGLQADIRKCEFHVQRTKFLGLILTIHGLEMDPDKVAAVKNWKAPTHLKEAQGFIGFCNFYRRFIKAFSRIVRPLTKLTGKDTPFIWDEACEEAFNELKQAIIEAPTLRHYNPTKQCVLETDASNYVTGGVLSQYDDDGVLHPIAFYSKNMLPAECNYHIYDKELLAIIKCLENWRPELEGTELPIQVFTDHKGLEYFMTSQKLTQRQCRYLSLLSEFNFHIMYQSGKKNDKADALTRMSGAKPESDEDKRLLLREQIILTPDRLEICTMEPEWGTYRRIEESNRQSETLKQIRQDVQNGKKSSGHLTLAHASVTDGVLYHKQKLWVPSERHLELIQEVHTQPLCAHPGRHRTVELLTRYYYWPDLAGTVTRFLANCHVCLRSKPSRLPPNGLLHPNPIPEARWTDISIDFITGLPNSDGFNAILTVICRLTKMRHYIPCWAGDKGTDAEATAKMMIREVFKYHGLPSTIISDRGPQFVSDMWKSLCVRLLISPNLSTSHHPETDGQTERANQDIEQSLRKYVNHLQDDWARWLPMMEFADNDSVSSSTKMTPFYANHGFHPRMSFGPDKATHNSKRTRLQAQTAHNIASKMSEIKEFCQANMKDAQKAMTQYANRKRREEVFEPGDLVMLNAKYVTTDRPCKKLDDKRLGPFFVKSKHYSAYKLDLPDSMKCHNVFHASLLTRHPDPLQLPLEGQLNPAPEPVIVDDEPNWELEQILDSRYKGYTLQYRCKWLGLERDLQWYGAGDDEFGHAQELRDAYHTAYPDRPGPALHRPLEQRRTPTKTPSRSQPTRTQPTRTKKS